MATNKTATLYVGGWSSRCGACNGNADPNETHHINEYMQGEGCGAEYTNVVEDFGRLVFPDEQK